MVTTLKALGDENRLRIVCLLLVRELCVCELETILGLSQSNASRHLAKLRAAGIVKTTRDGQWIHYLLTKPFLEDFEGLIRDLRRQTAKRPPYRDDLARLARYGASGFNCRTIQERPDLVKAALTENAEPEQEERT